MTKPIRSPLRAFAELLDYADTISINGGPRMSKDEVLRKIEESEADLAALLAADNKKARSDQDRAKTQRRAK